MIKKIMAFVLSITMLWSVVSPMGEVKAAGSQMKIHSIYLGAGINGDATLIESNGEYILMDLGDEASYSRVKKYLQSMNVKKMSLYISHFHGDHTAGLSSDGKFQQFLKDFQITKVYLPDKSIYSVKPDYYKQVMEDRYVWVENRLSDVGYDANTTIKYLKKGSTFNVGTAKFNIIGPVNPKKYSLPTGKEDENEDDYQNNCSLVCRVTCGSKSFLTAGDMKIEGENDLIASYGNSLKSDIYKMSHHGMFPANSAKLMKYIRPDYSFASNAFATDIVDYGTEGKKVRQTYSQRLNCGEYGFVYTLGEEKKSLIIDVKDNDVSLYRSGENKKINADGWSKVYGADGVYEQYDYYYFKNGVTLKGIQKIDGKYYNLGNGGCKQTGTYNKSGSNLTYYGWDVGTDGSRRYYTEKADKSKGAVATDFAMYTGKKYIKQDKKYYYFDKTTGYLVMGTNPKGWEVKKIDGNTYAVYGSGMLKTSSWLVNGKKRQYFDAEGKMLTGWQKLGGAKYYLNSKNGYAATGFTKIAKNYYLFSDYGKLQTNKIKKIGKDKRYFDAKGKMATGWTTIKGGKYYFDKKTGYILKGFQKIGGKYYLFWDSGKLGTNTAATIDGYRCTFDSKGQWSNMPKVDAIKLKTIKSPGKGTAMLSWKVVEASGYEIYMSESKNGAYKKVKTIKDGSTTNWQQNKLKSGKKYYFKVKAYKSIGGYKITSEYSAIKSIKIK